MLQGAFGILQPSEQSPVLDATHLDVVILPALAADPNGHRIGYGRGFFDRFLPRCPQAFTICVIFDFQLIAEVPALEHDVPVDLVLTDTRTHRISA